MRVSRRVREIGTGARINRTMLPCCVRMRWCADKKKKLDADGVRRCLFSLVVVGCCFSASRCRKNYHRLVLAAAAEAQNTNMRYSAGNWFCYCPVFTVQLGCLNCHTLHRLLTLHFYTRFIQSIFRYKCLEEFSCLLSFTQFLHFSIQNRNGNEIQSTQNVFTHNARRGDPERTTDRGSEYWRGGVKVVVVAVMMKMVAVMRYFYLLDNLLLTLSLTVHGMEMRFG